MADPHPPLVKQNIQNIEYGFIECLTQQQPTSDSLSSHCNIFHFLSDFELFGCSLLKKS